MSDFDDDYIDEFGGMPIKAKTGGGEGNFKTYPRRKLETFDQAKKFYAQIINDYASGQCSKDQGRTLGYLMAGLLSYFKLETDQELLKRIESLEQKMEVTK